jgi:hypothetical protein
MASIPSINANVINKEIVNENKPISTLDGGDFEFHFHECKFKEYVISDSFAVYNVELEIVSYILFESIPFTVELQVKVGPGDEDFRTINLGKYYVPGAYPDGPPGSVDISEPIYILSSDLESIDEERYFAGSEAKAKFYNYMDYLVAKKTTIANYWYNVDSPDDHITASQVIATDPQEKWVDDETFTDNFCQNDLVIDWDKYPQEETNEFKDILSQFGFGQIDKYTDFNFVKYNNGKLSMNLPIYKTIYLGDVLDNLIDSERMGWRGDLAKYIGELTALFGSFIGEVGIVGGSTVMIGSCLDFLYGVSTGIYFGPANLIAAGVVIMSAYLLVCALLVALGFITVPATLLAFIDKCRSMKTWAEEKPWNNKIQIKLKITNLVKGDKLNIKCRDFDKDFTISAGVNTKELEFYVTPEESGVLKSNFSIHNCQVKIKINNKKQETPKILSFAYSDGIIDWTFNSKSRSYEKERFNLLQSIFDFFPRLEPFLLNI